MLQLGGSKYGGINSFNEDLVGALSEIIDPDSYSVACVVQTAKPDEVEDASKKGIILLDLPSFASVSSHRDHIGKNDAEEIFRVIKRKVDGKIIAWIGHDVITGFAAVEAKQLEANSRSVVIRHMDYWGYTFFKTKDGEDTLRKKNDQDEITAEADIVFAVGPKLAEAANDTCGQVQKKAVELIPGLANIKGRDSSSRFHAITHGRFDSQSDKIKLGSLAVAAFSYSISKSDDRLIYGPDPSFTIFGVDSKDKKYFEKISQKYSKIGNKDSPSPVPLIVTLSFTEERKKIYDHLRNGGVSFMLSRHEGFGLSGWESIAAEVPLIVSKNSGLYCP